MSPCRELINDFKKPPPCPEYFYMPIWTGAELAKIQPLFPSIDDWTERFNVLGGVPRFAFERTRASDPSQLIRSACGQFDLLRVVGMHVEVTEKTEALHRLIHITSAAPHKTFVNQIASTVVMDEIEKRLKLDSRRNLRILLGSYDGYPLFQSLCGHLFEAWALEVIERGGFFNSREISHANNTNQPSETIIRLESSSRLIVDTIQPDQQTEQLHVPKDRNFAGGLDAWIPGFGAFQITVGQTHTIDKTVPNKLSQLGRGANRLYWLLPSFRYNSWTKKTPFDIEQYAILIPTPSSVTDIPIVSLP